MADALRQDRQEEAFVSDWRCEEPSGCGGWGGDKYVYFQSLPKVLMVELDRYSLDRADSTKVNTRVPLETTLDLGEFSTKPCPADSQYRLRSVVPHIGRSRRDGHYTCWVRDRQAVATDDTDTSVEHEREVGLWTEYNDSTVTRHRGATLPPWVEEAAYILFYERLEPSTTDGPGNAVASGAEEVEDQKRNAETEPCTPSADAVHRVHPLP